MKEKKRIAIVGGGASGIISGYLLHKNHEICIYEKQAILGGNIRTLNKNILGTKLPEHIQIENGVLGFSQSYYPKFHALLKHLEVDYHSYEPSISLFSNQLYYPARISSYLNIPTLCKLFTKKAYIWDLLKLKNSQKHFEEQIAKSNINGLDFNVFDFHQSLYKKYIQTLFMLSFSTPFTLVSQLPQSLINPYFLSLPNSTWSFIKGGVYQYIDTIIKKSNMKIHCNAQGVKVTRNKDGINLKSNGLTNKYDKVIIATTPGSVKNILMDMNDQEMGVFKDWDDQVFTTVAHQDLSFYGKFKNVRKTPMDLFFQFQDNNIGYNTYQNTLYNLPSKVPYSFAYNLERLVLNESILHESHHTVPKYSKNYDAKIKLLHNINGRNNTYFAGAYMENGLHEGAVLSAMNVSSKLKGIIL